MSQLTSQKAAEMIGNRYDLILIATLRARELRAGARPMVKLEKTHNKNIVTALQEIEEGHIGNDYLLKVKRQVRSK